MTTILTSREFNQNASEAKRCSLTGPVIITDRGRPSHVLLSFADYQKLAEPAGHAKNIVELLAMLPSEAGDIAFEPSKADMPFKAPDLS